MKTIEDLQAEMRIKDLTIGSMCNDLRKMTAAHDAALETINQQHRINVELFGETEQLKSALREAKEALIKNIVGTGGRTPAAHNAIATINQVLGESNA